MGDILSPNRIVLVSTLGLSPSVVTETVDAMIEIGKKPNTVYLLSTSSGEIDKCIELLIEEFSRYDQYREIELNYGYRISKEDIFDEKDNLEFLVLSSYLLETEARRGSEIYLSISGGRKTMSAALFLLGQIYGVRAILHVLVPEEIERRGNIRTLLSLPEEERAEILHPKEKRLIFFPVIRIIRNLEEIIRALRGEEVSDETIRILEENGLMENGRTTDMGGRLKDILDEIESFPPPSTRRPEKKIRIDFSAHHFPENIRQFVNRLSKIPFVEEIRSVEITRDTSSRARLRSGVAGELTVIYSDGNKGVRLIVKTTSSSRGQDRKVAEFIRASLGID